MEAKTIVDAVKYSRTLLSDSRRLLKHDLKELKTNLVDERQQVDELLKVLAVNTPYSIENCLHDEKDEKRRQTPVLIEKLYEENRKIAHVSNYLICIRTIHGINDDLVDALKNKNFTTMADRYRQLRRYCSEMKSSRCVKLASYIRQTKNLWKKCLIETFHSSMNDILNQQNFASLQDTNTDMEEFKQQLSSMLAFCICLYVNVTKSCDLFVESLLTPLRKRFVFYFSDPSRLMNKKITKPCSDFSNNSGYPDPSWYLSLVLSWHRRYTSTLLKICEDQNEIVSADNQIKMIPLYFCRGLVVLARERFKLDLTRILDVELHMKNDRAFSRLIDESVAFDFELRDIGFMASDVACVELLTEPGIFERWLELEHQQCTKCLESLLDSPSAWEPRYTDDADLDQYKVPRCVDNFFSLISSMTNRYKLVRSRQHKIQFSHLQRTLIDDFRMHLFQLTRTSFSPWTKPFPQIMNAVFYVKLVLTEWQELHFFMDIQTGIFDELIDLYSHFRRQMLDDTKEAVLEEIRPKLVAYKREISSEEIDCNSAAVILIPTQIRLLEACDLLNSINFRDWLRLYAAALGDLLNDELVFDVRVDSKMGSQMFEDLAITLPRLFHLMGLEDTAVHFNRLIQCLSLLSLSAAGCILLKASLCDQPTSLKSDDEDDLTLQTIAKDLGIPSLSRKEIDSLLQRRSDISVL